MGVSLRAVILGGVLLSSAAAIWAQSPPFHQCPAMPVIGTNGCKVLIVINPTGAPTVLVDPAEPYFGGEDVVIGVVNNSATPLTSLPLSAPGLPDPLFGFDQDGPNSTGTSTGFCPSSGSGPTGYEGPGTSFSGISADCSSGVVNFSPAVAANGGTAWFTLEGAPTATDLNIGPPNGGGNGAITAPPALQCTFNAAVTPTVRAEGLSEQVGDIVLNCTGGTPTRPDQVVPQANITVFLSTNVTSRITSNPFTEALLLVDEPHSAANPGVPLAPCDPGGTSLGICSIFGAPLVGGQGGIGTYNPTVGGTQPGGVGTPNRPRVNVFQARLTGNNQVTFFGVPIDPPGPNNTRIIRITNLRGNANQLGVSSTLIPTQIVANISVNPPNLLPLNNPQQTVAFVARGLTVSSSSYGFIQCQDANGDIARSASSGLGTGGQNGQQFAVTFTEGFASAFKEKNIAVHLANTATGPTASYPSDAAQDVPGANYFSESGFLANGVAPSGGPPLGYGPFLPAATAFPATRGLNLAGMANAGTRLMLNFASIPGGTQLFVPTRVDLTIPAANNAISGFAVLVSTDANGGGSYSRTSGNSAGLAPVTITGGAGTAVYEILYTDPFNLERVQVKVAVAFTGNQPNNLPAPGVQSTVAGGFAPLSNVGTASDTAPIPRFAPSGTPVNSYIVRKCSCNVLFPFVSNLLGYDTGIAVSNTSIDPFGTTSQSGTVTLNYYSAGTPPPAQTTNAVVTAGDTLAFTLSGGGNYGIAPTPGFQGYIIAQSQFQFCHAFAYISAQGGLPSASGASVGYLGIVLDLPALNRTGQLGEVQAH